MDNQSKLYIMISRTDTGVGKLIRKVTGFPYNHVSVTLDPTFRNWVSFARYQKATPLYGGFIREPVERFLAKGERIDVRIFAVDVSPERYRRLEALFALAGTQDPGLRYNLFALVTLSFGVDFPITGAYTCLGFANRLLGTRFKTIQKLNDHLMPRLHYEGSLGDLAPDSGCREDLYFQAPEPLQSITCNIGSLFRLIGFALTPGRQDPVSNILESKGASV